MAKTSTFQFLKNVHRNLVGNQDKYGFYFSVVSMGVGMNLWSNPKMKLKLGGVRKEYTVVDAVKDQFEAERALDKEALLGVVNEELAEISGKIGTLRAQLRVMSESESESGSSK